MPILEYDLAVIGRAKVERELALLERRFVQHSSRIDRAMGGSGRPGAIGTPRARQVDPERAAAQAAKQRQQTINQTLRSQMSLTRQRQREEREAERELLRSARERQRVIDRTVRSQTALARQREREQKAAERIAREATQRRAAFIGSTVGNTGRNVVRGLSAVGGLAFATMGLGGAALAASSVMQAAKLDEMSRRLSIAGRGKGQAGVSPEQLRRQFTQTGIATGFAPEAIAAGAQAYVTKTGDLETAMRNRQTYATVAQAAGADVVDVFSAAADLASKLDVKSVEDMAEAFAVLSAQGKKGAFELKAMASEFPEILASASVAGVRGVEGVRDVGALAQLARQASGSDSEATTAIQTLFRQLSAKAEDLQSGKALGGRKVQVFEGGDARKPMRNFADVVTDVLTASEGNLTQFQDIFDIRGSKAGNPLANAFRSARNQALEGGASRKDANAAGTKAVRELFNSFRGVSGDFGEIERDARDAMKSFSVQMEIVNTQLKQRIADTLFPALQKLVPTFDRLIPSVGRVTEKLFALATAFAENPFTGMGALVSASLAKELASAGLGAAAKAALESGIAGLAASGGLALALGIGAFTVAQMAVKTMLVEAQQRAEAAAKSGDEVRAKAAEELRTKGYLSQETRNELEGLHNTEQSVIGNAERSVKENWLSSAMRAWRSGGAALGLNDNRGTLEEAATWQATASNSNYRAGAVATEQLMWMDEVGRRFESSAEQVKRIMVDGASEAATKLKDGAEVASKTTKPNRGDSPTSVKG